MKDYSLETEVIQNLEDAGCDEKTISAYIEKMRNGEQEAGRRILETYRRSLLEDLHGVQKHIDCLDYLLWQTRKKNERS
ncbi:MAG: hypothetical protein NC086_07240 [Alistipes sp.]|nr:hypothetical protein [Alistipes sp.]